MIIGFGKHKGRVINDLPSEYLEWLVGQGWVWETMRIAAAQELQFRADVEAEERDFRRYQAEARQQAEEQRRQQASARIEPDATLAEQLITRGYRALVQLAHPDRGGSHQAMLVLTATKEYLLSTVRMLPPHR